MFSFVGNKVKKIVSFTLLVVMGFMIANKCLYTHTHKFGNGSVVVHSHPYNKTKDSEPYKSHHHTNAEYLLCQNLYFLFLSPLLIFSILPIKKGNIVFIVDEKIYSGLFPYSCKGRAPPVLSQ